MKAVVVNQVLPQYPDDVGDDKGDEKVQVDLNPVLRAQFPARAHTHNREFRRARTHIHSFMQTL